RFAHRFRSARWLPAGALFDSITVCGQTRGDDSVRIAYRLAALDLVDILHPADHPAPHGVLAVEEWGVVETDEDLAIARIGILRACHRAGAAHMRLAVEFRLELLA